VSRYEGKPIVALIGTELGRKQGQDLYHAARDVAAGRVKPGGEPEDPWLMSGKDDDALEKAIDKYKAAVVKETTAPPWGVRVAVARLLPTFRSAPADAAPAADDGGVDTGLSGAGSPPCLHMDDGPVISPVEPRLRGSPDQVSNSRRVRGVGETTVT
jgi:hypothetical protein